MKKLFGGLFFGLISISVVSAQYASDLGSGLGYGMEQLINIIEQIFGPFFAVILGGGDMLFERILFLVVVLAIVYIVASKMELFKDNEVIIWIVSISVALLSTRFLVENGLVQTMILPYSAFGISITAALPLVIYFYFVQSFEDSSTIRRMLWIFYIVVFIGIWGSRYEEVGNLGWIYLAGAGFALIFFLFDGTIRRAIVRQRIKQLDAGNREGYMIKLRREMGRLEENKRNGYVTDREYKRLKKSLAKQMRTVVKG